MIFRKAILIIHGFSGGPFELEYLSNNLEFQRFFDVFTFTLPGHDFESDRLKHEDFIKSAEEHIELLINYGYKEIYVIGHSMGGVIACHIAGKYKEVKRLVLIAPAFHYLAVKNDDINLIESLKSGIDILKEYKLDNLFGKVKKMPINAPLEFVHLVKDYYDTPLYVSVPTLIIWGTKDTVVPFTSAEYVFKSLRSKYKFLLIVRGANHNAFKGPRKEETTRYVIKFLKDFSFRKKNVIRKEI